MKTVCEVYILIQIPEERKKERKKKKHPHTGATWSVVVLFCFVCLFVFVSSVCLFFLPSINFSLTKIC